MHYQKTLLTALSKNAPEHCVSLTVCKGSRDNLCAALLAQGYSK